MPTTTAKSKTKTKRSPYKDLQKFLDQNQDLKLKTMDLNDASRADSFNWSRLKRQRETILELLPAYQRLLNVVPDGRSDLAVALLQAQLHSALQIAAMPRMQFLTDYAHLTKDKSLLETCYSNAQAIRARLLVQYVNRVRQSEHPAF